MNKIKKQNGITILGLIITIIVLLIIATVTIGTMKNKNIVGYAQDAAESYAKAEENEAVVWDEGIGFLKELQGEDGKDESEVKPGSGTGNATGGENESEDEKEPEDENGDVIEDVYYDISFLDLSTSGWSAVTLPTETEKLIFMFENSENEKGFITIQKDGSVAYFEKMNNVNIYSYASAINQWLYVETREFVSAPPSISNVKIITDSNTINAALRELLDEEEEMYTWEYMTNEQIDKIIALTVHQEL